MFDRFSDYALNKENQDAIVCKSVTGRHIMLRREDFSSEDEFLKWKSWSDKDYAEREAAGHEDDRCYSLDTERDTTGFSAEDEVIDKQGQAALEQLAESRQAEIMEQVQSIRNILTKTQYRRLWMLCVDGLSAREIAARESVSLQRVYCCLEDIGKRIVNNL